MPRSILAIASLALVATYAFFFEYMPPFRQAHVPYDMAVYHYSLADYGFQSLKAGRVPQWDPTMYAGMSFPANIQAAFYYPPTWAMYAVSWGRDVLSYQALQDLLFAHVWIAWVLAFVWLRARRLDSMACALGAAVFAYSGYACTELQHFGLVAGYAWIPLALWGVDEAGERRNWWPLWKVAAASALCFLAGYPPTWVAFALIVGVYALFGPWRVTLGVGAALVFSLVLCAVQLLPVWGATEMRVPEERYGGGIRDPWYFLSYLLPNFYDFGPDRPIDINRGKDYFYLGAPGLIGLALLLWRPRKGGWQALAVIVACLVMVTNPWDKVWEVLRHSALLGDVVRSYYFLCGVTLGVALLSALGLDSFLSAKPEAKSPAKPGAMVWTAIAAMNVWGGYELWRWPSGFAAGWGTAADVAGTLAVTGLGLWVYRGATQPRARVWLGAALLLAVGVDYKVFGTNKRFNAGQGEGPRFSLVEWPAMDAAAYAKMRGETRHRVVLAENAPYALEWRHVGLTSPQGFDPFLSAQYRQTIDKYGTWRTDREFDIDPANAEALRLFGAKYYITANHAGFDAALRADARWKALDNGTNYFSVYEWLDAGEPFEAPGEAEVLVWEAERRVVRVRSAEGGTFALFEQWWPGWSARVDGSERAVEKWGLAYQSVEMPAGEHTVEFRYRERYLGVGAGVSLVALVGLGLWVWRYRRWAA